MYCLRIDNKSNETMIQTQLIARGIRDERVLDAFREVPRELFLPEDMRAFAYLDSPQAIGYGQTISQPYMVAIMTELLNLKGTERVLEIGTGSGYQAAILARLAKEVYSIERIEPLANFARENLKKIDINNVKIFVGDGSEGLPKFAPYDRIIITCAVPYNKLENSPLLDQLTEQGFILAPVGSEYYQELTKIYKEGEQIRRKEFGGCVFVKMVGKYGWSES